MYTFINRSLILSFTVILTACAYGQFGAIDERYGFGFSGVPSSFGKESPNTIGSWKFYSFAKKDKDSDIYLAQYYDTSTIKRVGNNVSLDIYSNLNISDKAPNGKDYLSKTAKVKYDCSAKTYVKFDEKYFVNKQPTGKPIYVDSSKSRQMEPLPEVDTITKLSKMVCPS